MFRYWSYEVETWAFKLLLSSHQGPRDREWRERDGGAERRRGKTARPGKHDRWVTQDRVYYG